MFERSIGNKNMTKTCKKCTESFELLPNHQGLAIHCPGCAVETTTPYMACVSWDGKSHGSIEITKDTAYAKAFNHAQKRSGYGVGRALVERKAPQAAPTQSKLVAAHNLTFTNVRPSTMPDGNGLSDYYKRH